MTTRISKNGAKHTPGPWRVGQNCGIVGGKYGSPVCDLPSASMLAGSIAEHTANANLIAAAPDLLAALETIAIRANLRDDDDPSRECAHILSVARAVIRRARGE